MNKKLIIVLILLFVFILCCLCISTASIGGVLFNFIEQSSATGMPFTEWSKPTDTPVILRPTTMSTVEPTSDGYNGGHELMADYSLIPTDTLKTLKTANVPINDLIDLSERLEGLKNIPVTLKPPITAYQVGETDTFWLTDSDNNENFQIDATLRFITDHLYFWIEDNVKYDERDLRKLGETFEGKIYPRDREFFGSEWTPGVDGDPHIYIIYATGIGSSIAGYFSAADEYTPLAHEYSNAHETFILNADNIDLSDDFTYGVLAHEFQHMIHWYQDRNESTWLNEGFSELASFLNGYDPGGFDYLFAMNPDLQLNDWPNNPDLTSPHYGEAFLFLVYFLDRFGEKQTQSLVSNPANGLDSIDSVLKKIDKEDNLYGGKVNADSLFYDWATALFVQDGTIADGRFAYSNYPMVPGVQPTEEINDCPLSDQTRDVHQYGMDYIQISCKGEYLLHFEGSTMVKVIPVDSHSGNFAFWSNKGDESDMTLTKFFDFHDQGAPITLSYWAWYDIEKDYDYVYVEASTDGQNWKILTTPSGTLEDPSGNSFGWAYNGLSGGDGEWIQETVDLSDYAGEKVQIRFEYITDAAVNGEGFLLDDIEIEEINYFSDFEQDDGGWEANGYVRIENILPQTFGIVLVTYGKTKTVERISLNTKNEVDIPIDLGGDVDSVILIVMGTTRYTREKATYRYKIVP